MNMQRASNSPAITEKTLLGPSFYEDEPGEFKTIEQWQRHKAGINKMAQFHQKVLQQLLAGEREGKIVMEMGGAKGKN